MMPLFVLLLFSIFASQIQPAEGATVHRRFLLNNDGSNLFWRDDLSMKLVRRHVSECPDAITTYLLCPNGIQKMFYPSAHEELSTSGVLSSLVAAGEDPFGEFIEGLKKRGFETFVTFRMNEVHNVDNPNDPNLSSFWREHPEYRVERGENPGNWMAQCLDYSLEPVRERTLRLLVEILEKYQPDGIELDWMRFPRHLSGEGDEVWGKRHHLTSVVVAVREATKNLEERLGRHIAVAVRVPTSLAGCRALGVDIVEWNRQELIDFLTVAPFLSTDFSMPIREMRSALSVRPIPIYAGVEFGYGGNPHREETLRAAALGLFDSGADGIYIFNFPCWRELQAHPPWSWIPLLRDPALLKGRDLIFPIISDRHRVARIDLPAQLPKDFAPNEEHSLSLSVPRIALANDNRPTKAILQVEPETDFEMRLNDVKLESGMEVPVGSLRSGINEIILKNIGSDSVSIASVELQLSYPM
ncbi:MAG: hypothetical protein ABIH23_13565, partial [bacterium]